MNSEQDLVFIGDGKLSFLIGSLKDMVERNGITTVQCDISMKALQALDGMPKLFVTDAETLLNNAEARVYLYDKCIEENRKIVLIGDDNSLTSLYNVTSTNIVAQSFKRPINITEIADRLKVLIKEINEKGTKIRILVVDDAPTFLRVIVEWLDNDYNVSVCTSATAAFHMIETNRPDLILLDYEMPICNGGQFLQMLRSEPATADIPVMFLTSKDDAETVRSLLTLKPQGYLLKNQSKENIVQSIRSFLVKENIR